ICDSDISKAQALAARFDVKETFDDIEEVLKYSHPSAVAICTPNHLHEIHVVSALAAGAHVLCERPLALTLAGVERVLQASEKYGRRVMVGMNHRFHSDVQAVRGFLAGGDIGMLQAIRCGWYTFQPSRNLVAWRRRRLLGPRPAAARPRTLARSMAGGQTHRGAHDGAGKRQRGGHGDGAGGMRERPIALHRCELASHG